MNTSRKKRQPPSSPPILTCYFVRTVDTQTWTLVSKAWPHSTHNYYQSYYDAQKSVWVSDARTIYAETEEDAWRQLTSK